jgi:acyl carrier protein
MRDRLSVAEVRRRLREEQPKALELRGVPNARVRGAIRATELLAAAEPPATVGLLRAALQDTADGDAVDPESWWTESADLPYQVELRWPEAAETVDVWFRHRDSAQQLTPAPSGRTPAPRPLSAFANNPLHLASRVPEYMVPATFMIVHELPLTPNGKVDRRRLPPPHGLRSGARPFVAPRTETERRISELWEQVLDVDRVGAEDNFFELGGHSLLATRITYRIRETMGLDLPLRAVFEHPTVAELGARVDSMLWAAGGQPAAGVGPSDLERPVEEGEI